VAGNQLNEALILEADERLSNRRAADTQLARQLMLEYLMRRGVLIVEDALPNFSVGALDKRLPADSMSR
jgi:hypothetical protein